MATLTTTPVEGHAPTGSHVPERPRHLRGLTRGWGVFMLAMAGVNGGLAAAGQAQVYVAFADTTPLSLYRTAWDTLVAPAPLPWVVALTGFEAAVGLATLGRGRTRVLGLAAATVFIVALTPAAPPYTLGNPVLAALPAYLAIRHHQADTATRGLVAVTPGSRQRRRPA